MKTLKELYLHLLQDSWSANKQAFDAMSKMVDVASEPRLKEALEARASKVAEVNRELASVIQSHDAAPDDAHCRGMAGLVTEAHDHAIGLSAPDAVKDASLISQYQRLSHYRIAAYGTAVAMAKQLGASNDVSALEHHLDDAYRSDRFMSELAETRINSEAA